MVGRRGEVRQMSHEVTFGEWLKQRRTELGVTGDQLAERLSFSLDLLRKLESGARHPSGQITRLLADYFRIPTDEREAFVSFARTGGVTATPFVKSASEPVDNSQAAPWRSAYVRQTNLPAVLTPLIGREQELEAGHQQILNPKTRLLTLIGPPGIGKTRLALQVASNAVEHFDDGIFFVDLSPVSDPDSVLPTIGRALGLKEAGERPIEELLLDFARDKRALLVLDNFEQVLDAAPLVVKLMESGPWLKAVVTSREALHVRGERHLSVPALNVPDMNRLPPVESLLNYSAVELFAERAVEVAPGFVLTDKNAEDVAQVCVALEGLPLAIELAAARLRHLSPRVLRAELSSRLKLLTGGRRDLPPRQRTLFSAIEWSYDLLSEKEQDLFAKLGVFSGGFTASAVYAVCGAKSERDVPAVQEILFSLVDKSIVKEANSDAVTGDMRFGMLEVIREFAVERLEERGEIEEARQRHALYFMALAEESEFPLSGADQIPWLNRLEAEYDNLLAALRWSVLRDP
jgi:predicted ATPase/DNA-binding XRE family transcriptional regulator